MYGGSHDRVVVSAESGGSYGNFGYFVNARYFDEQGWRDASPSDALNIYGTVGWHTDDSTVDLGFLYGKSDLIGNGSIPLELAFQDRAAVFTSPDITENDIKFVTLEGTHWLNDNIQLAGNAYWRETITQSFNGDDSGFIECQNGSRTFLAMGDDDEEEDDEEDASPCEDDTTLLDQNGNLIASSEGKFPGCY